MFSDNIGRHPRFRRQPGLQKSRSDIQKAKQHHRRGIDEAVCCLCRSLAVCHLDSHVHGWCWRMHVISAKRSLLVPVSFFSLPSRRSTNQLEEETARWTGEKWCPLVCTCGRHDFAKLDVFTDLLLVLTKTLLFKQPLSPKMNPKLGPYETGLLSFTKSISMILK